MAKDWDYANLAHTAKAIKHFKKKKVTVEQAKDAELVLVEKMNEVLDEESNVTPEFEV